MNYANNDKSNPNEYTCVNGYDYTQKSPAFNERELLKTYSNALSFAVIGMFLSRIILSDVIDNVINNVLSYFGLEFFLRQAQPIIQSVSQIAVYTISLILPFCIYVKVLKVPYSVVLQFKTPDKEKCLPSLASAFGCSVFGIITAVSVTAVFEAVGFKMINTSQPIPTNVIELTLYIFQTVIIASFIEEIVFRGAILQSLRRFGDKFAIITSALIFGAVHTSIQQSTNSFVMGIVIAFFTIITGSLWTGIIIHSVHNGTMIMLSIVGMYASDYTYTLTLYCVYAIFIIASIIGIIALSKRCDYVFNLVPAKTIYSDKQKMIIFFTTIPIIALTFMIVALTLKTMII